MSDTEPKVPFHPAPSVGHEIGVMFGFMAFFVLSMVVYYVFWQGWLTLFVRSSPIYSLITNPVPSSLVSIYSAFHLILFVAKPANSSVKLQPITSAVKGKNLRDERL